MPELVCKFSAFFFGFPVFSAKPYFLQKILIYTKFTAILKELIGKYAKKIFGSFRKKP